MPGIPRRPRPRRLASLVCASLATACRPRAPTPTGPPVRPPAGESAPAVPLPPASLRSVPLVPAPGCPAVDGARGGGAWAVGTVHAARVERDETWTAEGSPHELPDGLTVAPGASVTLTACAWLRFAPGTALRVSPGAALIVQGEAGRPVRFGPRGEVRPGAWAGLVFERGARPASRLNRVVIEGAGGQVGPDAACVRSAMGALDVTHVTLEHCRGHGVALAAGAAFRTQSDDLIVRHTARREDGGGGSPVWLRDADAAGTLPALSLADNGLNAIEIVPATGPAVVTHSARWRDPGAPYLIAAPEGLIVAGPNAPALTVEPGVELRFLPGASLHVGVEAPAGLIARSTREGPPIVLAAAGPSPWAGVYVGPAAEPANVQLENVRIVRAAGPAIEPLCAQTDAGTLPDAALHWMSPPRGGSLSHVRVLEPPPGAVALIAEWRGGDGHFGADALEGAGAGGAVACRVATPADPDGGCVPAANCP